MTATVAAEVGVLDTSTLILLERIDGPWSLPRQPAITAITLAELSVGPLVAADVPERATRQARLQQAEADFDPLPFDAAAARAFGRAASLRQAGRKAHARAYDAMIAAIAISNNLPLYTCNPRGFEHMDEVDLICTASGPSRLVTMLTTADAQAAMGERERRWAGCSQTKRAVATGDGATGRATPSGTNA